MTVILILSLVLATLVISFVIICMTIQDIRTATLTNQRRRHPYARKWRARPHVAIIINGEPTAACLAGITKSSYRNKRVTTNIADISEYILQLPNDALLPHHAIKEAVFYLMSNPGTSSVSLFPVLPFPHTLQAFFRHYLIILISPLSPAYSLLGGNKQQTALPSLSRSHVPRPAHPYITIVATWLLSVITALMLLYAVYLSVAVMQPLLLLTYLAGFCLWALWAIAQYPTLGLSAKICYFFLLPAALPSIAYRLISSPLRLPIHHLRRPKVLS